MEDILLQPLIKALAFIFTGFGVFIISAIIAISNPTGKVELASNNVDNGTEPSDGIKSS